MKELQDTVLPGRVREIAEICGAEIPYEVDWESFNDDLQALNYMDNLSCHRLNMALRVICMDDMGKEAVRDSLKLIRLRNVKSPSDKTIAFSAGVLEMQCAYALLTEGMHSDGEIRQVLMKGL